MSDHPVFDTYAAIYRYDGGWAFEDNCMTWRPWSSAWERLCGIPWEAGWPSPVDEAFAILKEHIQERLEQERLDE